MLDEAVLKCLLTHDTMIPPAAGQHKASKVKYIQKNEINVANVGENLFDINISFSYNLLIIYFLIKDVSYYCILPCTNRKAKS